jgi:hypothetical protein
LELADALDLVIKTEYRAIKKRGFFSFLRNKHHRPDRESLEVCLFLDNAFYLLEHKERILSDSRMFLCNVHIQGTMGRTFPTLGSYIEWWLNYPQSVITDSKGRKSLVYQLFGSILSGRNRSQAIREDGKCKTVVVPSLSEYSSTLSLITERYRNARRTYQAYKIQQVLAILREEDNGNRNYVRTIER